jgi:hypothetical protein
MTCSEDSISQAEIDQFKNNIASIDEWASGGETTTVIMGSGGTPVPSPLKVITDSKMFKAPVAYNAGTQYTDALQTVSESGVIYGPNPTFLPIGPEAFDSGKWYVIQGGTLAGSNVWTGANEFPNGLFISGSASSNLLEYYDFANWTPVIADDASAGNVGSHVSSPTLQWYERTGNMVTCQCFLQNIDTTGMTGANNLFIRGLPFVASSVVGSFNAVGLTDVTLTGNYTTAWVGANLSYMQIRNIVSASGIVTVKVSDIASGSADIFATFTYRV